MEHPGETQHHGRLTAERRRPATIWKTDQLRAVLSIGRKGPAGVCSEEWIRLSRAQGEFGCDGHKPTISLLYAVLGSDGLHRRSRRPQPLRAPHDLIGTEAVNGREVFCTARAKQYLSVLCALLARVLLRITAFREAADEAG